MRNAQDVVESWATSFIIRQRSREEVITKNITRKEYRGYAKTRLLNLRRDKEVAALVRSGLGDVSDRPLITVTITFRKRVLSDIDFSPDCGVFCGDREGDLIADCEMGSKKMRQS